MAIPPNPPRGTISLLDDPSVSLSFQFNPNEVQEKIEANFNELEILGQGHRPEQYKNTSNFEVSFDLAFDQLSIRGGDLIEGRNTLLSFCYPRRGGATIESAGPGKVVFDWPNLYSIAVRVRAVDGKFTRFNASLAPTLYEAKVTIFESRDKRLYAEDVRARGTVRR